MCTFFCNNSRHYVQISLWFCPGFCMHLKSIKVDPALTLKLINSMLGFLISINIVVNIYKRKILRHPLPKNCF